MKSRGVTRRNKIKPQVYKMEYLIIAAKIIVGIFILDRTGLWLEKKGWVHWRRKKSTGGGMGNAFQELHSFLNPSSLHVLEVKQKDFKQRDDRVME